MTSHLFQHLLSFEEGGPVDDDASLRARLAKQSDALQRIDRRPDTSAPTPEPAPSRSEELSNLYGDRIPLDRLIPRAAHDLKFVDDTAIPVDKDGNPIPWTRRPGVLPVTREADGSLRFAMPSLVEIMGNVAGPVPAGSLASGLNVPQRVARIAPKVNPETGFYSAALNAAENLPRAKGRAIDFYNDLKNTPGVKPAELEWTGTQRFLTENGDRPLSKEELVQHLDKNQVQVKDNMKGFDPAISREALALAKRQNEIGLQSDMMAEDIASGARSYEDPELRQLTREHSDNRARLHELRDQAFRLDDPQYMTYSLPPEMPPEGTQIYPATNRFRTEHGAPLSYREHVMTYENPPQPSSKVVKWDELKPDYMANLAHERMMNARYVRENGGESLPDEVLQQNALRTTLGQHEHYEAIEDVTAGKYGPGQDLTLPPDPLFRYPAHWKENNPLAHMRMSDRTGPNGERILYLDEIQSDWGQQGRREGFSTDRTAEYEKLLKDYEATLTPQELDRLDRHADYMYNQIGDPVHAPDWEDNPLASRIAIIQHARRDHRVANVPNEIMNIRLGEDEDGLYALNKGVNRGPFVESTANWLELAQKRALYRAAKEGYDAVAWSPGEIQARRYNLGSQIQDASYRNGNLEVTTPNGLIRTIPISEEQLPAHVGQDLARVLLENPGARISGDALWAGGEGHRSFYDNMVPKAWNKVLKRHDPSVQLEQFPIQHQSNPVELKGSDDGFGNPTLIDKTTGKPLEDALSRNVTTPMSGFRMTPKMRDSILKGQPLFVRAPLPPLDSLTHSNDREKYADGGPVPLSDEELLASTNPTSPNFAGPMGTKGQRVQQLDSPSTISWRTPLQVLQEKAEKAKHMVDFAHDVSQGKVDLRSTEGVDEALGMSGALADLGLTGSSVLPQEATTGMFIGRNAKKSWDPEAVKMRRDMLKYEVDPGDMDDQIWAATGTMRFPDGSLRQEIDDSVMKRRPLPYGPTDRWTLPLERVLDHPELYENYPHLKDILVESNPDVRTAHYNRYHPNGERIVLGGSQDDGTLLHEIQHAVDAFEGHGGKGSSPSTAYRDMMSKLPQSEIESLKNAGVHPGNLAYQAYVDEVGEQIAELTAKRKDMPMHTWEEPDHVWEKRIRDRLKKDYAENGDRWATKEEYADQMQNPLAYADMYGTEGRQQTKVGRMDALRTPFLSGRPVVLGKSNPKQEKELVDYLIWEKGYYGKTGREVPLSDMIRDYPDIPTKFECGGPVLPKR